MSNPRGRIVRISVSLTEREAEMLDRISWELYGDRERVQSMTVAALIREKHAALFGREAAPTEAKKDESGDTPRSS